MRYGFVRNRILIMLRFGAILPMSGWLNKISFCLEGKHFGLLNILQIRNDICSMIPSIEMCSWLASQNFLRRNFCLKEVIIDMLNLKKYNLEPTNQWRNLTFKHMKGLQYTHSVGLKGCLDLLNACI